MANGKKLDPSRVLAVVLGGGRGTRLFPLTQQRAKPAVPLGGKYRLVDIPISNCLNSGVRQILILTQFNSASLHRHVYQTFRFDRFSQGFVEILAAEQTPTCSSWYQGTADAVRKNLHHFDALDFDWMLILSGDQLYRMDFRELLSTHIAKGADITIATHPVSERQASSLGIMAIDLEHRIIQFVEKPQDPEVLRSLEIPEEARPALGIESQDKRFLASMGIYLFERNVLYEALNNTYTDFGKHIIPDCIKRFKVFAHIFHGYWEDIGTIKSFFEANIDLTSDLPRFNLFDPNAPIYTSARSLPPAKINEASIDHSIISDGCIINGCLIRRSVVGLRTVVQRGVVLERCVIMGADYYEFEVGRFRKTCGDVPPLGIGEGSQIRECILDKNVRIGKNCVISPAGKPENMDHDMYYIRDGIVVIPKNAVIPDGTVI